MSANREKTSSVMGLVMSVLLHGIFFAGLLALDVTTGTSTKSTDQPTTAIKQVTDQNHQANTKS